MLPNPSPPDLPVFHAQRTSRKGRPWPLTVLCLGGLLLLLWTWWHALTTGTSLLFGPGYWVYLGATSAAFGVGLLGLWHLRRWALWAFPLAVLGDTAIVFKMGELHPGVLLVEGTLVLVALSQFRAFRRPAPTPEV
jgi:hypothetical protein